LKDWDVVVLVDVTDAGSGADSRDLVSRFGAGVRIRGIAENGLHLRLVGANLGRRFARAAAGDADVAAGDQVAAGGRGRGVVAEWRGDVIGGAEIGGDLRFASRD